MHCNKEILEMIKEGSYDDAWRKVVEFMRENSDELLSTNCESNLIEEVAFYMQSRDREGKFYGYLSNYSNNAKQLMFQKIRKYKKLCKLKYKSVAKKPDEFFFDRYNYDAKQFLKDMLPRRKEYITYIKEYDSLYGIMADNESKKTFLCLIAAGVFLKYEYYELVQQSHETNYYPQDIFPVFKNECIADCGGYNGDTIDWFIRKFDMSQIMSYYMYEADTRNSDIVAKKFSQNPVFHIRNFAVSDKEGIVSFNAVGGGSGFVGTEGILQLPSVTLDSDIKEPITLVKMDIEGAELEALRGGENHIKKDLPKLAICAYHKPEDLRVLIGEIITYRPDYRIYLRHYSPKHKETVIYAY